METEDEKVRNTFFHAVIFMLIIGLASCSTWYDAPIGGSNCTPEKIARKSKSNVSTAIYGSYCANKGKSFGNDLRCHNGRLQIKCK